MQNLERLMENCLLTTGVQLPGLKVTLSSNKDEDENEDTGQEGN